MPKNEASHFKPRDPDSLDDFWQEMTRRKNSDIEKNVMKLQMFDMKKHIALFDILTLINKHDTLNFSSCNN